MASSNASARLSNKIIVKGIPLDLSSDKIIIHFQRKKNVGGGDVESVTFPKSQQEKDSAIVEFSEAETVQSVLKYQHQLGGNEVTVREYNNEQVFGKASCEISSFVVEKLRKEKRENELYEVENSTGVTIRKKGDGFQVSGNWYQMQAAYERIEQMIYNDEEKPPLRQTRNENISFARTSSPGPKSVNGGVGNNETRTLSAQLTSVIWDKDLYSFINLAHSEKLDEVKRRFGVLYEVSDLGGLTSTKLTVKALSKHSDVDAAAGACNKIYEKVSRDSIQETVDLDSFKGATDKDVEEVLSEVRPEFPKVWISRMQEQKGLLICIADSKEMCKMTCEQVKYNLTQKVTAHENENKKDEAEPQPYDRDIYKFIELAHSTELNNLSLEYGVELTTKTIGDATHVEIQSDGKGSDPVKARQALDKLYSKISNAAAQEVLDLSKESEGAIPRIDGAITTIGKKYNTILITRIDDQSVMLIADSTRILGKAIQDFKDHLNQHDKGMDAQCFDNDMFAFISRMHAKELDVLKKKYSVALDIKETSDAALVNIRELDIMSDCKGARKALAALYEKISDSTTTLPLDLDGKSALDLQLIDKVIETIKPRCPTVHISRLGSSKCLFIADDTKDLDIAVQLFTRTLSRRETE